MPVISSTRAAFGRSSSLILQLVEGVDLLEGHVDDVLGLDVVDRDGGGLAVRDVLEFGDELAFRVVVVIGGPDDLHDPVDHVGGGPLGEEQMEALEKDVSFVFEPPGDNLAAEVNEMLKDLRAATAFGGRSRPGRSS